MKQILLATTNLGKRQEMLSALLPLEGIEFVFLEDLDIDIDVEETGESYAENALQKARAYFAHSGMPTIAEDSGVEISALQDELGIHTRRWGAGPHASDEAWMQHFMERMAGEEDRDARFVCHSVYIDKNGHQAFEGECQGGQSQRISKVLYYRGFPCLRCSNRWAQTRSTVPWLKNRKTR